MNTELIEKTDRLAAMLTEEGLDGVLLNAQHNFAWLSGGGSNGVDLSRETGVASLLVTRDARRYLIANNIEMPRMLAEEVSASDFEPLEFAWQDGGRLTRLAGEAAGGANIASDLDWINGTAPIEHKVASCRYQLTAAEIRRYRELGRDAGVAVMDVVSDLKPGLAELEIAERVRHRLAADGMNSVVTLVAADERIGRYRHPVPTSTPWSKTLLIVTCAKRGGLIANLSRVISAGTPSEDLITRTEAAAYVNSVLLNATRPGTRGSELYAAAAAAYASKGFRFEIDKHHQGGATGYRTRDWVAHPDSSEVVNAGQAFAWNPSITGTKVEESCILLDDGIEIVTASPGFPTIATVINGTEYLSPGIFTI